MELMSNITPKMVYSRYRVAMILFVAITLVICFFISIKNNSITSLLIITLPGTVGVIVLHEALHGLAFKLYGGKVKFGAAIVHKMPCFYTTTTNNLRLTVRQTQTVALMPQILTVVLLIGSFLTSGDIKSYLQLFAIANLMGGVLDIFLALYVNKWARQEIMLEDGVTDCKVYTLEANQPVK